MTNVCVVFRRAILEAYTASMRVGGDVDLASAARRMEGFSPADIQALVYNAQLLAVHDALDRVKGGDSAAAAASASEEAASGGGAGEGPVVTAAHFERALADVRPSLSAAELRRYERTFADFMKSHSGAPDAALKKSVDSSHPKPTKSTLA
jgi:SpoVK/Ycf46/Vps4 family AAA+-type ATPase